MIHRYQDSSITKNVLGLLPPKQYLNLTGTIAQLYLVRMLQRTLPAGFIVIARKNGEQVRLYSRPGNDLTRRFPLIVKTLARLRSRCWIIDGEAIACDDSGVPPCQAVRPESSRWSYHRP